VSVTLRHVRHRVGGPARRPDYRLRLTACGLRFLPGGSPRDWAVHEPATSRCGACTRA
jgi:hypothetical protein